MGMEAFGDGERVELGEDRFVRSLKMKSIEKVEKMNLGKENRIRGMRVRGLGHYENRRPGYQVDIIRLVRVAPVTDGENMSLGQDDRIDEMTVSRFVNIERLSLDQGWTVGGLGMIGFIHRKIVNLSQMRFLAFM